MVVVVVMMVLLELVGEMQHVRGAAQVASRGLLRGIGPIRR